jgi:hypothetical protein
VGDERVEVNLGMEFAQALASKDWPTLRALLHDDLDFRAMTPRQMWEAGADDLIQDVFRSHWFEDHEVIEELVECETRTIGDVVNVRYLLRLGYKEGPHLMEQQAYYRSEEGRIKWLRIMCTGAMAVAT